MAPIRLHYLIGDVHRGGHDVHRVAANLRVLLREAGGFDLTYVCDTKMTPFSPEPISDVTFAEYFRRGMIDGADVIVFNCGNYRFNTPEEQKILTEAVAGGVGFVFLHGDHPCYWAEVGMKPFPEIEKMAMLMWREPTSHGDYGDCHVTIRDHAHPITAGLGDFDTRDELFCRMKNVWGVPAHTLATAYSDKAVISRHGQPGTGEEEPVVLVGQYGQGRTVNQVLGHVWPFYTMHGMGENTMRSFAPRALRQIFVRSCEWAATGDTVRTRDYDGRGVLV
ncbi:MAG: ThuA domain-containing protein [Clostridia bacterium]|nr:ThuA domain-containing protein [Clostridia bacterium]